MRLRPRFHVHLLSVGTQQDLLLRKTSSLTLPTKTSVSQYHISLTFSASRHFQVFASYQMFQLWDLLRVALNSSFNATLYEVSAVKRKIAGSSNDVKVLTLVSLTFVLINHRTQVLRSPFSWLLPSAPHKLKFNSWNSWYLVLVSK